MHFKKFVTIPFIIFLVLTLPAVFLASLGLKSFLPPDLFYSVGGTLVCILTGLALLVIATAVLFGLLKLFDKFSKLWRVMAFILLGLVILTANLIVLMTYLFVPFHRFAVGEGYCEDPLIAEVQRCEGLDTGILQDRSSAVARFGPAVKDIEKAISAYPDFSVKETDCKNLPGQFGQKCYEGSFSRNTGDINFLGIYVSGTKVLVIETENIPLITEEDLPVFAIGYGTKLSDFVDVTRFANEMKSP